ncbi:MAG: dTDP-4-dehydrorhamnose reductase [Steroidobacteraceae bacterium]
MKVLVVGRSGQLAAALRACVPAGLEAQFGGRESCDLRNPAAVAGAVAAARPSVVINAAAYSNVEQAEREQEEAFRINGAGVGALAGACAAQHARLLHVSTDYVFDGAASVPYLPEARPAPLSVYGASKLDGERRIAATAGLEALIVRTSWVYSPVGRNFLLTMFALFRTRGAASVVCDQFGSPTSAHSLAQALWILTTQPQAAGIAHFADQGVASWYDFAVAIAEEALRLGLLERKPVVTPIRTADYPSAARRPLYSVLDTQASVARWGLPAVPWREALAATLERLAHA